MANHFANRINDISQIQIAGSDLISNPTANHD
jgi:hypothetical protein